MSSRKSKRKLPKAEAKKFLASPRGKAWLERKIADKRASRKKAAGPKPRRLSLTKFPFNATINGRPVVVRRRSDEIEVEDAS